MNITKDEIENGLLITDGVLYSIVLLLTLYQIVLSIYLKHRFPSYLTCFLIIFSLWAVLRLTLVCTYFVNFTVPALLLLLLEAGPVVCQYSAVSTLAYCYINLFLQVRTRLMLPTSRDAGKWLKISLTTVWLSSVVIVISLSLIIPLINLIFKEIPSSVMFSLRMVRVTVTEIFFVMALVSLIVALWYLYHTPGALNSVDLHHIKRTLSLLCAVLALFIVRAAATIYTLHTLHSLFIYGIITDNTDDVTPHQLYLSNLSIMMAVLALFEIIPTLVIVALFRIRVSCRRSYSEFTEEELVDDFYTSSESITSRATARSTASGQGGGLWPYMREPTDPFRPINNFIDPVPGMPGIL